MKANRNADVRRRTAARGLTLETTDPILWERNAREALRAGDLPSALVSLALTRWFARDLPTNEIRYGPVKHGVRRMYSASPKDGVVIGQDVCLYTHLPGKDPFGLGENPLAVELWEGRDVYLLHSPATLVAWDRDRPEEALDQNANPLIKLLKKKWHGRQLKSKWVYCKSGGVSEIKIVRSKDRIWLGGDCSPDKLVTYEDGKQELENDEDALLLFESEFALTLDLHAQLGWPLKSWRPRRRKA